RRSRLAARQGRLPTLVAGRLLEALLWLSGLGAVPGATPDERGAGLSRSTGMAASGFDDAAWLTEHQTPLVSFVLPIVNGDRQALEAVVTETMLRGWQNAEELSREHARRWRYKVARNIAISTYPRRRQARPREVPLDETTTPAADDAVDGVGDALLIASAL